MKIISHVYSAAMVEARDGSRNLILGVQNFFQRKIKTQTDEDGLCVYTNKSTY
jgi:hypothetical protein